MMKAAEVGSFKPAAPRLRAMRSLNVGCGNDVRPAAEGWTNMDVAPIPGVQVVHDALRFPWPFADASFDHVLCRHIIEHIPHNLGLVPYKDGFLRFMEECHRILRPGGILEIATPHPRSLNTIADPTHTRIIHPNNFASFDPDRDYAFRHYTSARFRRLSMAVTAREAILGDRMPLGRNGWGFTVHLAHRLPFLKPLLIRRPSEMTYILERV